MISYDPMSLLIEDLDQTAYNADQLSRSLKQRLDEAFSFLNVSDSDAPDSFPAMLRRSDAHVQEACQLLKEAKEQLEKLQRCYDEIDLSTANTLGLPTRPE